MSGTVSSAENIATVAVIAVAAYLVYQLFSGLGGLGINPNTLDQGAGFTSESDDIPFDEAGEL
jgi:hypothetical protein